MTASIDDLISRAAPRTGKVRVCSRGDLVDRHRELVQLSNQVDDQGSLADGSDVLETLKQIKAVEDEMEASAVTITISTVPQRVWADLLLQNPPTVQQRFEGHDHDPVRFPIAVVAACAIEPEITVVQAAGLYDALPFGEWTRLWLACAELNTTATPFPKLLAASELLQASETSGLPSEPASLAGASSAGSGEQ